MMSEIVNYKIALEQIKSEIKTVRFNVAKKLTHAHIHHYYCIGKIIVENQTRQGWGKSVVELLSKDLQKEFGLNKGYSARNLWDMRRFFERYSSNENLRQLVAEIPWSHNLLIMSKIGDQKAIEYYIKSTRDFGWSRNVLLNQIKADAYNRSLTDNKSQNFKKALPESISELADEALKSEYNLDFLGLKEGVKERELENKITEKIRDVIMEFGNGFAFIGNQYKLNLGSKDYYLDLLFYHRELQSLIAIELKTGEFKPEYAGKLNFYLEVLDDTVKKPNENPSIGILLCAEKDNLEVEYALRVANKPIGIAEYQLTKVLPKELQGYLPDKQTIKKQIIQ